MRSLRRSITVYLLGLLAITLGVVGFTIDQVIGRTLDAQQNAAMKQIDVQYEARCRDEHRRVDDALLQEAGRLGKEMQVQYHPRYEQEIEKFNASRAAGVFAFGNPLVNIWLYRINNSEFQTSRLRWEYLSHVSIGEGIFRSLDEREHYSTYLQVNRVSMNSPSGRTLWRSESLDDDSLPFDVKKLDEFNATIEDASLAPSGLLVRRVIIKVAVPGTGPPPTRNLRGGRPSTRTEPRGGPGGLPLVRAGGGPNSVPPLIPNIVPMLYLQCAVPVSSIDATLATFESERDTALRTTTNEIREERADVRMRLGLIGLITFVAIGLGGPLLVGRGLRPLRSLSDAVSRVSEKDFRLPHDGQGMPRELTAIHGRLTQTLEMLRRAFAREKQAVADISHELRTPIASLQATLDVAVRKPRTPEQYRATLEECRLINKQLGQLVERIMTLASLDSGNDRTELVRIDAAEVVAGCAAVIRPLAGAHGQTLDVKVDSPLELDTDPDKLREVLMNLLHNAVEYNRTDGSVEVGGRRENGHVLFEVRDTGIGMTTEVRERIFERFYRADASRHATGVHAGLGLAIVKEYVHRLGGTIDVSSEAGQGSCFRLTFPAPQDSEPSWPVYSDRAEPTAASS